jgi:hypothetical protein
MTRNFHFSSKKDKNSPCTASMNRFKIHLKHIVVSILIKYQSLRHYMIVSHQFISRGVAVVVDLVAIFYTLHFLSSVTLMLTMMMMMMYTLCASYIFAMRTFCDAVVNGRAEKIIENIFEFSISLLSFLLEKFI